MQSGQTFGNNRRRRRYDLGLPATILKVGRKNHQAVVQTRNISSSGILLEFDHEPKPGTIIELQIDLPGENNPGGPLRLRCMGQVVRVDRSERTSVAVTIQRYEFLRPPEAE